MSEDKLPPLVAEALDDIFPYDADGDMARRILLLAGRKKRVIDRGELVVNRATLTAVITGDPEGARELAKGYAKALQGFGIIDGRKDLPPPALNTVRWINVVEDEKGAPREFGKALDALYAAKWDAEGGVLLVEDIFENAPGKPPSTAAEQAKNGALQHMGDLLTEYAEKSYTPVVLVAGTEAHTQEFFAKNRYIAGFFNEKSIRAKAGPQPEPSVELGNDVKIGKPITLKRQ